MIFRPELAAKVLAGKKTQTRIRVQASPRQRGVVSIGSPPKPRCPVSVGSEHPVHTRAGGPELGRVAVEAISEQRLRDLRFEDARAEGYRTRGEFARAWLHDRNPTWDPDDERSEDECWARFIDRYGDWRMWVITFSVFSDHARFLSTAIPKPKAGKPPEVALDDGARGYATGSDPLDAGESVTDARLALEAREAADRFKARRAEFDDELLCEKRGLEERLAVLRRVAAERGINVSPDVRVIEQRMERIEHKIRRERDAA